MDRVIDIAVVGATGLVGEAILAQLDERKFPVGEIYLLASDESAGDKISFKGHNVKVGRVADFDFSQVQIAFFAANDQVSKEFAGLAADMGCVVIDSTSALVDEMDIPVVLADVNPDMLAEYSIRNIVSSPSAVAQALIAAVAPIHRAVGVESLVVNTYEAVSGSGKKGVEALAKQTAQLLNAREVQVQTFPRQIAFNVIPQVGSVLENGYTSQELEMLLEVRKALGAEQLSLSVTCTTVPVFFGHSISVFIETSGYVGVEEARELLNQSTGVDVMDAENPNEYATAVSDAVGSEAVLVSRVREDLTGRAGVHLWINIDNVKMPAINAVQIAETMINSYL